MNCKAGNERRGWSRQKYEGRRGGQTASPHFFSSPPHAEVVSEIAALSPIRPLPSLSSPHFADPVYPIDGIHRMYLVHVKATSAISIALINDRPPLNSTAAQALRIHTVIPVNLLPPCPRPAICVSLPRPTDTAGPHNLLASLGPHLSAPCSHDSSCCCCIRPVIQDCARLGDLYVEANTENTCVITVQEMTGSDLVTQPARCTSLLPAARLVHAG